MSGERDAGAAGGGGDLRSAIAGALADERKPTPAAGAGERGAAAAPGERDTAAGGATGERDERDGERRPDAQAPGAAGGEIGAGGGAEGAAARDAGEGAAPAGGAAAGEEAPTGAGRAVNAPEHWAAADKAVFDKLPEAAKSPFLDLYKRMEAGLSPKLQRGAQLERDYGELDRLVFTREQREIIRQKGYTPVQLVNAWADVERGLGGQNPVLKAQLVARMIHNYGVDPGEVATVLHQLRGFAPTAGGDGAANGAGNGTGNGGAGGNGAAAPAIDPALHARLTALETDAQRRQAETEAAAYRSAGDQIAAFANEADEQGQLKHPFFAELEADMTGLAQIDRMQGKTPVLQDLYDRALWANQSTRERHLAAQRDAEAKRAADERKAKAEQAKRAASSVTGAAGTGQAGASDPSGLSIRDQLIQASRGGGQTSGGPGRI